MARRTAFFVVGTFLLVRHIGPCSTFGHRRFYSAADDETYCTKCVERWRDGNIDGTPPAHYTLESGWVEEKD